jgi:hypothetical protein
MAQRLLRIGYTFEACTVLDDVAIAPILHLVNPVHPAFSQGTFTGGPGHPLKSFTGTFNEHGVPHGKGLCKATFQDGSTYRGEREQNSCTFWSHCLTMLQLPGSFRNGLLDKGELTLPNGTQISGKWRNGQLKVGACKCRALPILSYLSVLLGARGCGSGQPRVSARWCG